MTPEQLEQLQAVLGPMVTAAVHPLMMRLQQSEAALAQVAARQASLPDEGEEQRPGQGWGGRATLDDRDFRLMSKFSGDMNTWDNWKHAFLLCFYKVPELYEALVSAVRQAGETADF